MYFEIVEKSKIDQSNSSVREPDTEDKEKKYAEKKANNVVEIRF